MVLARDENEVSGARYGKTDLTMRESIRSLCTLCSIQLFPVIEIFGFYYLSTSALSSTNME